MKFVGPILLLTCSLGSTAAFMVPVSWTPMAKGGKQYSRTSPSTSSSLNVVPPEAVSMATSTTAANGSPDADLLSFFIQTVISYAVPAFFALFTLGATNSAFQDFGKDFVPKEEKETAVSMLYNDLYGDGKEYLTLGQLFARSFRKGASSKQQLNLGIPQKEFIKVTHLNNMLQSYDFSMSKATKSKALAASHYRNKAFDRALERALAGTEDELPPDAKSKLVELEKHFLQQGKKLMGQLVSLETSMTSEIIDKELKRQGLESADIPPESPTRTFVVKMSLPSLNGLGNITHAVSTALKQIGVSPETPAAPRQFFVPTIPTNGTAPATKTTATSMLSSSLSGIFGTPQTPSMWTSINTVQKAIKQLELGFIVDVIDIVGPKRGLGIREALLGDMHVRGSGSLLTQLQDRPLSAILKCNTTSTAPGKSAFVLRFDGDMYASQLGALREEVTAIIRGANPGDEAVVVLSSGGGTVVGYGSAAGQLVRLKEAGLNVTVAVEQVAASGGYLMASVADRIVASPFAVLGSIGVVGEIPNFYDRLQREGVEFHTITAGKYKRTVTPTKKVTPEDLDKTKEEMEEILTQFSGFLKEYRPQLDVDSVSTGETWYGKAALARGLCDDIKTTDDLLMDFVQKGYNVYDVEYKKPEETDDLLVGLDTKSGSSGPGGFLGQAVRWAVNTVANEVKKAIHETTIDRRYMARDDSACRLFLKA
eukprot:Nitzschia sp. Nitz4//scaffold13_size275219//176150//178347//NITZ4_000889-RA/size275219-augustus-gene-0.268-mRNA-1//-1//CDS//3329536059//5265//frame0